MEHLHFALAAFTTDTTTAVDTVLTDFANSVGDVIYNHAAQLATMLVGFTGFRWVWKHFRRAIK